MCVAVVHNVCQLGSGLRVPPTHAHARAHLSTSAEICAAMMRASCADSDSSSIISVAMHSAVSSAASNANSMVLAVPGWSKGEAGAGR